MLINKYLSLALNLAVALVAILGGADWSSLAPKQAGTIIVVIAMVKAVLNVLQPPASQPTITATGNALITHT